MLNIEVKNSGNAKIEAIGTGAVVLTELGIVIDSIITSISTSSEINREKVLDDLLKVVNRLNKERRI